MIKNDKLLLGWCSSYQIEQMFINFYKNNECDDVESLAKEFAEKVVACNKNISPAQIQGFFLFYKNEPDKVIDDLSKLWEISDNKSK